MYSDANDLYLARSRFQYFLLLNVCELLPADLATSRRRATSTKTMILRRFATTASASAAATKATSKPVRQTKKQKKALEHSRILAERLASGAFAQTLEQPEHSTEPSPTSENPSSADQTITLQTLATYRPTRAPPVNGPIERYRREYERAFARIDKAFVKSQLVELWDASVREASVREQAVRQHAAASSAVGESAVERDPGVVKKFGPRDGKRVIVGALLESWGWPRVEVVERERQAMTWGNTVVEKGEFFRGVMGE